MNSRGMDEQAAEQAFYFMAMDEAAKRAGLFAAPQEMGDVLAKLPQFQKDGKFSVEAYNEFFEKYLKPAGCTQKNVEDAIGLSIRLQKLSEMITANAVVTELDVQDFMNAILKKTHLRKVTFDAEKIRAGIKVTDAELKAYYDANPDKFMTQPVSNGLLAYIPVPAVSADAKQDAKQKSADEAKRNAAKTKVIALFREVRAASKEPEYAKSYTEIFRKAAAKNGLQIMELKGLTPISEPVQQIEPELIRALTGLKNVSSVTNVVEGKNGFYAALLTGREDAHAADFNAVKADIEKAFREERTMTVCKEKAANLRAKLAESAAPAKDLEKLAKAEGAEVTAVPDISQDGVQQMMKDPSKFTQDSYFLFQLGFSTEKEKLSSEIFLQNACFMVFVDGYAYPAAEECKKAVTDEYRAYCLNAKKELMAREYQNWIFANVKKYAQKGESK